MKIILSAFGGKLSSGVMDIPGNSTPYWDMVLTQPLQVISGYDGRKTGENPSFNTMCRFEFTGKINGGTMDRIYVLRDISKF